MEKIDLASNKNTCCGCGMCQNICPKQAISMVEDEYGFMYPEIDESKCIKCGLCLKTCAYKKAINKVENQSAYAAVNKDKQLLLNSASGGIFSALATNILKENGIVFGCSMEKDEHGTLEPRHIKIDNEKDLIKLQGSKYVQSITGNVYNEVKNELKQDKLVLFSGTPCQVAALKSFLFNVKQDKLFTIDIICHGVPSTKMFKDYINYLENKHNIKITNFNFRDKSKGWGLFANISFEKNNVKENKLVSCFESSYYQLFLDSYTYRENCYDCKYANSNRIGDITIGDYWGIEQEHPELKNNIEFKNGVSCIIINNENGLELVNKFGNLINKFDSKLIKIEKHNGQLCNPSTYRKERNDILDNYKKNGYETVDKWYKKNRGKKYLMKKMWYKLPYFMRKMIKK